MMFNVVYALGELAVMYPVTGGFYTYSVRFIDPSWGFAMGWNYVFQWLIVLPLELTVAGLVTQYWDGAKDVGINIFGALGFAEEEFWSSCLKLITIITFMVIALVLVLGWTFWRQIRRVLGSTYLVRPGCFPKRIQRFLCCVRHSCLLLCRYGTHGSRSR